jgi:predicted ATPase with chaperone activity
MSATMSVGFAGARSRLISFMAARVSGGGELLQLGFPGPGKPERHERIRSAVRAAGLEWPQARVTVLAQPGAVTKTAALSILSAPYTTVVVAPGDAAEAARVPGITVVPMPDLAEVVAWLRRECPWGYRTRTDGWGRTDGGNR